MNTTKTEQELYEDKLMAELDEIIAEDARSEDRYKAQAAKRQLSIAVEYGGPDAVLVGEVTRKHMDIANKRLLLDVQETVITKTKNGTQKHRSAFIQAVTSGEVAELRRAISTYTDWAVIDRKTNEVIVIVSEDNE